MQEKLVPAAKLVALLQFARVNYNPGVLTKQ
jgi:hypothetical protein